MVTIVGMEDTTNLMYRITNVRNDKFSRIAMYNNTTKSETVARWEWKQRNCTVPNLAE